MFSYETIISYSRVDRYGKVPMHEILNLMQDCSTFHSESIGRGVEYMKNHGKGWILIAYKVSINKPILFGQKVTVGTSPSKFSSIFASRQYFIKDENGDFLVKADSIWVISDINTRKPIRITEEDSSVYETFKVFDDVSANRKINFSGERTKLENFKVLKTYIDTNGHMNNANYLRAAKEFLPDNFACREFDIVYNKEAMEGETIIPYIYKEEKGLGISFENENGENLTKIMLMV